MELGIQEAIKKRKIDFEAKIQYASDVFAVVCQKLSWGLLTPPTLSYCCHSIQFVCCCRTITLKTCRRLLEQDMGLQPGGLDDHKGYVKELIETVAFCKTKHASSHPRDPVQVLQVHLVCMLVFQQCC